MKTKKQIADDLRHKALQLRALCDELDAEAEEIEAHVMKKTTQRSPEWRGGANC